MKSADWLDDPEWLESLPVRGAWVEIPGAGRSHCPSRSLPVRGAWVEMQYVDLTSDAIMVAPRAGSVG